MNFDQAVTTLIATREQGYSNNSHDPGGETMWGITRNVALRNGYEGDMHVLPKALAESIYQKEYWAPLRLDEMPDMLRYSLFDAAVNSGLVRAATWLQQILGVTEDGVVGPATIEAAGKVNPLLTAVAYEANRLEFFTNLPTWGAFGRGWARRIVANLKQLS